jgi:hypothetical protein
VGSRPPLIKLAINLRIVEFCLVLPYIMEGRVVARAPVADWPAFSRACAALGARELPMRVIDDAELVFLCSLTQPHFMRRESETRVRQLYQQADMEAKAAPQDGCDDPPAEDYRTVQRRRIGELAQHSSELAGLDVDGFADALAALTRGALVCEVPPKILQMSEPEIAREYPYATHGGCKMLTNLYVSTACAVDALQGALADFPWRASATGAPQFILAGGAPLRHLRVRQCGFTGSDFDFFLVGVDAAGARAAIAEFHAWVAKRTGGQFMGWRTEHAVSFVTETVVYQVVLRLNPSIERVLLNFDIDVCCVAFDGERLWTTPRGLAALRSGINLGDPERQSTTFDRRAAKYCRRGYRLAFPGLSAAAHARIYSAIDQSRPGLSKALLSAAPARSMIERVMRGGQRPAAGDPAAEGIPGDYAPHFALPGGRSLTEYIRTGLQALAAPGANTLSYLIVATTALAPLLDTPRGAALADLRAAIGRGDPHFVYTSPSAPANSIKFLVDLGHGQLSGSIHPVAMSGWFP